MKTFQYFHYYSDMMSSYTEINHQLIHIQYTFFTGYVRNLNISFLP